MTWLQLLELRFEVNILLCKASFSDNYKFKILKCRWNPNEKKWFKSFSKKYYPNCDNKEYMNNINKFINDCAEQDIRIEYIEGLDELKKYIFDNEVKVISG